jgi:hypothetical protein
MATQVVDMPTAKLGMGDVPTMLEEALQTVAAKSGQSPKETLEAMRGGDCATCETVRYRLAEAVAECLAVADPSVKAVYLYEPEYATGADSAVIERPNLSPGISMIVWSDRKSAALSAVVASLDSRLAEEADHLACPQANALCWTLDAQIVDDHQVQSNSGYGALINSLYVRPVELWHR